MKLTQDNLDRQGALYAVLASGEDCGRLVGVEPCESDGDIELRLYDNLGSEAEPAWEVCQNETYSNSPYGDLAEVLRDCPELARLNWKGVGEVEFV